MQVTANHPPSMQVTANHLPSNSLAHVQFKKIVHMYMCTHSATGTNIISTTLQKNYFLASETNLSNMAWFYVTCHVSFVTMYFHLYWLANIIIIMS